MTMRSDGSSHHVTQAAQVRRAWIIVFAGFVAFVIMLAAVIAGSRWFVDRVTEETTRPNAAIVQRAAVSSPSGRARTDVVHHWNLPGDRPHEMVKSGFLATRSVTDQRDRDDAKRSLEIGLAFLSDADAGGRREYYSCARAELHKLSP
jgi:hypothetical protein